MSDITVIGLGAMGAALAQAQLKAGHSVTVWNRSAHRAVPLQALGAMAAASVAEAVRASPVIMICIDDYTATMDQLAAVEVVPHLAGRTMIQFSTGTPKEARGAESWLAKRGADYLDGAIMVYPDRIGLPDTLIMIGGKQATFAAAEAYMNLLGGDIRYLGENIAAPAAIDLAILSVSAGLYLSVAHGAQICQSAGVGLDQFAAAESRDRPRELAEIIHADAFELNSLHPGAALGVWAGVVRRLQAHASETGSNSELPDFLSSIYQRAEDAGYGDEDIAALVKALR